MIVLFNHLPRTGGHTVADFLGRHLALVYDYVADAGREAFERWCRGTVPARLIRPGVALVGHFTGDGCRPEERYPALMADRCVIKVTLLREPRELALSSVFYRLHRGECRDAEFASALEELIGIYARLFEIRSASDDIDAALDRYDVVGLSEEMPRSLARIATRLRIDDPLERVPRLNRAPRRALSRSERAALAAFDEATHLDRSIYERARERFATREAVGTAHEADQ